MSSDLNKVTEILNKEGIAISMELGESLAAAVNDARIEAIGWTWAEACATLDAGDDPRKIECSGLIDRAKTDLTVSV